MRSKAGNVHAEDRETKVHYDFQEGDLVALTPAAIRRKEFANMTPRLLYEIGHPNTFVVLGVHETKKDGICISLFPCCTTKNKDGDIVEGFVDRERNNERCFAHPASLFEKKGVKRMPKKGDKSTSIYLPFIPFPLAGLDYEEDEDHPVIRLQGLGQKAAITGPFARLLKNLAEENNIL